MVAMVVQVKRRQIESEETYEELFGREDSDEDFEALYIVGDEEEVCAEIYRDGLINGCNPDPKLFWFTCG